MFWHFSRDQDSGLKLNAKIQNFLVKTKKKTDSEA